VDARRLEPDRTSLETKDRDERGEEFGVDEGLPARDREGEESRESGARLRVENLPSVWGRRTEFTQLFQNLISNAIKYRGIEPPDIHVGARLEGRQWRFWVKDNGIGIAAEHAERIFQLFQRLHTREEYPGTGIGLAICKKVVEGSGGRIWAESEPGKGATFWFTLPARGGDGSAGSNKTEPLARSS